MANRSCLPAAGLAAALLAAVPAAAQDPPPDSGEAAVSFTNFRDASLFDLVEILARQLEINYVIDPGVRDTSVTVNTYGQLGQSDLLPLLETILRMNGAAAVQVGRLHRIVPLDQLPSLPIDPASAGSEPSADERPVLNAIRLQHTSAPEVAAVLEPFLGPGSSLSVIESSNTLLVLDTGRNMRRTMQLVSMFDVPELRGRAVKIFEVENSLATTVTQEIREVFGALGGAEPEDEVQFVPLSRIGAVLAVGSSEEALAEAGTWVRRLDRASASGGRRNFVYRAQYGEAGSLASTVSQLYSTDVGMEQGLAGLDEGRAAGAMRADGTLADGVRIVPDALNNVVLVQATPQEWESIRATLLELDGPPRQVLIDAKIYEVTLSGSLSSGVSMYLRNRSQAAAARRTNGGFNQSGSTTLSVGGLVGSARELAVFLQGTETQGRSRVISAPTLVATDNVPAEIVVGQTVPTLASQAITGGALADGSSLFANTISNVQTGVSLAVTARVNASGIVTMQILQEVSTPSGITGTIQSPTIDRRTVSTQVTVNDGDIVAIGGIIRETSTYDASRVPVLGRIPVLGRAFGSTRETTSKTELIVLLQPRVIHDQNQLASATEELRARMDALRRAERRKD